jgi:hypothetical protein
MEQQTQTQAPVPEVKIPEVLMGHTPLPPKVVPMPGVPPAGKFGPVTVEKALDFGAALQHLCAVEKSTIRRLGWAPDTQTVLLLNEEGTVTLRKPSGTLHPALFNTGDIESTDWVTGTV